MWLCIPILTTRRYNIKLKEGSKHAANIKKGRYETTKLQANCKHKNEYN